MTQTKNIKDYLHLYLGCEVDTNIPGSQVMNYGNVSIDKLTPEDYARILMWLNDKENDEKRGDPTTAHIYCRLKLRPLSDMDGEEAEYLAWLCMNNKHLKDESYRIDIDEIQTNVVPNDGGNALDENIQVYIEIDCRCWTGYLGIWKDGSILLREEDSDRTEPIPDIAEKIQYLLSCGFDLFNLIPEGLAIDKTTLK